MNLFKLSLSYIRQRKLNTLLNVLLLALGIATIIVMLLFSHQLEAHLERNAGKADVVIGAKGSPLQLVLSSIYHLDAPTGNIPLKESIQLIRNRAVKTAIPLALGDSYRDFRIVGTTMQYFKRYEAELAAGKWNETPLEVVIGNRVAAKAGLEVGATFASSHGLSEGGEAHNDHLLKVAGILKPTGAALDRLIIGSVQTLWKVHEEAEHEEDDHDHAHEADDHAMQQIYPAKGKTDFSFAPEDSAKQITALLIQYTSPMAAAMFPRFVNGRTNLQAASPALETARLFTLLGVGIDVVRALGIILIFTAALSVFIALYNALKQRRYDLAMMRTLGASRAKVLWQMIIEGILLTAMGAIAGIFLGHIATEILGNWLRNAQQLEVSGKIFLNIEWVVFLTAIGVGILAALLPALQAYRTDISKVLSEKSL